MTRIKKEAESAVAMYIPKLDSKVYERSKIMIVLNMR